MTNEDKVIAQNAIVFLSRAFRSPAEVAAHDEAVRWLGDLLQQPVNVIPAEPSKEPAETPAAPDAEA